MVFWWSIQQTFKSIVKYLFVFWQWLSSFFGHKDTLPYKRQNMPFESAKLKVYRAKEHIYQLNSLLESWSKLDTYKVSVNEDAKTGFNTLSLEVTETIPGDTALVIGDVIHNFRSALDHVIYEVVTSAGGDGSRVQFPFQEDRKQLITGSSRYREIERISPKAAALIADTIKPYKTGNYTLWALNKINNIDKHRLLIPSVQAISILVDAVDDRQNTFTNCVLSLTGAGKLNAFRTASKLHITSHGKPIFQIFFGPETFFDGEPILEAFMEMGVEVSKVIALFEKEGLGLT